MAFVIEIDKNLYLKTKNGEQTSDIDLALKLPSKSVAKRIVVQTDISNEKNLKIKRIEN